MTHKFGAIIGAVTTIAVVLLLSLIGALILLRRQKHSFMRAMTQGDSTTDKVELIQGALITQQHVLPSNVPLASVPTTTATPFTAISNTEPSSSAPRSMGQGEPIESARVESRISPHTLTLSQNSPLPPVHHIDGTGSLSVSSPSTSPRDAVNEQPLSQPQVDLVHRLLEQNTPKPAVAELIEHMLNRSSGERGTEATRLEEQPAIRSQGDTPPVYDFV